MNLMDMVRFFLTLYNTPQNLQMAGRKVENSHQLAMLGFFNLDRVRCMTVGGECQRFRQDHNIYQTAG